MIFAIILMIQLIHPIDMKYEDLSLQYKSYQQCGQPVCKTYEEKAREEFMAYATGLKITWYCKWCVGKHWRYDCSGIVSSYLLAKKKTNIRFNTYTYNCVGKHKTVREAKIGDIVVWMNKSQTGWNHTAIFDSYTGGRLYIRDNFPHKWAIRKREIPLYMKDYKIGFVENPIVYQTGQLFFHSKIKKCSFYLVTK